MSEVTEKPRTEATTATPRQPQEDERRSTLYPAVDIYEDSNGITLLVDMPGVSKERMNLHVDNNELIVEGDMEIDIPDKMESLHADVRATHYRRAFSLSGEQLDTAKVKASLKDGLLQIDIPKRAELQPRKIEVKAG